MALPDHVARREQAHAVRGRLEADRIEPYREERGRAHPPPIVDAAVRVLRPPIPGGRVEQGILRHEVHDTGPVCHIRLLGLSLADRLPFLS